MAWPYGPKKAPRRREQIDIKENGFLENPCRAKLSKPSTLSTQPRYYHENPKLEEPQPQRPRLERLAHVQGVLDLLVQQHI